MGVERHTDRTFGEHPAPHRTAEEVGMGTSWFGRLFETPTNDGAPRRRGRTASQMRARLDLEGLEERLAPAAWSAEGPAGVTNGQTLPPGIVSGAINAIVSSPTNNNIVY